MDNFVLKDNEIMIFTDFNNTLVDFENEYNYLVNRFDEYKIPSSIVLKKNLTKCLNEFEKRTGLTPVICIITNASAFAIDSNNYSGISQDLHMTFFDHISHSKSQARQVYENSCERYFKYLIYRENDIFFKINPLADSVYDMFEVHEFPDDSKNIKMIPQFKKQESIERMIKVIDPNHNKMPFVIFAGDSIKDDYPMKLAKTNQGTCKIFIRPGKVKIMKPSLIYEFCLAKGVEFSSIHPKTGKRIKCFDDKSIQFLNEKDLNSFNEFSDGDHILLTSKNSQGFIEGIYQAIDIINASKQCCQKGE